MDNFILFFDGCHKIYYADRTDVATIDQMKEWGYSVIDGDFLSNLGDLWEKSCSLRFIQPADLDAWMPAIEQGQIDGMSEFIGKLVSYCGEVAV
jgi:hypothetical protein